MLTAAGDPVLVEGAPRNGSIGWRAHQRLESVYFLTWEAMRIIGYDSANVVFATELTAYANEFIPGGVNGLSPGLRRLLRDGLPR